jgi:hypothetical protein
MVRHSVIAYRNDNPDIAHQVTFVGDAWLGYVPVRMPDTIRVQERLPPGAAAVLINRSHTYKDLFMAMDTVERNVFDGIDGVSRIGDIVESKLPPSDKESQLNIARSFFERLWSYDQVVFDISHQPSGNCGAVGAGANGAADRSGRAGTAALASVTNPSGYRRGQCSHFLTSS